MKFFLKNKNAIIFWAIYLAVICVFIASSFINYVSDKSLIAKGELETQTLFINDFKHEAFREYKEKWANFVYPFVSTDNDTQLTFEKDMYLNGISFNMRTHIPSGEMVLYYKTIGQADFSTKQYVFPTKADTVNGIYEFSFETKNISAIRLDPISVGGCIVELNNITLNPPKQFSDYFTLNFQNAVVIFLVVLALYVAFLEAIQIIKNKPFKKG